MTLIYNPFSKLIFKLKRNIYISNEVVFLLKKAVKLDIVRLSILQFSCKFINMFVMFLPLKVFLLLAMPKNIERFSIIEDVLGRKGLITGLLAFTAFLYLINILLQLQYGKLINKQKSKVTMDKYFHNEKEYSRELVIDLCRPCYLTMGAFIMISISTIVFFRLSIEFAFIYIAIFFIYLLLIEYFVFTNNKFKILKRLKIGEEQLIEILSSLLYLILFFSVFIIFTYNNFPVSSAVLILLLSRVANTSIKNFIINQHKLVKLYSTNLD